MNSSVKTFLSILILGLSGAGIYFGTLKFLVVFQDGGKVSVKKQIPVKPKNMKEKQALVESGSSNDEEFTFFDTLSDPSMSKFVDLNGSVADPAQVANDTPPGPTSARGDVDTISQVKNSDSENLLNPVAENSETVKVEVGKRVESVVSGFALQVGSFHQLERASLLKEKLVKKGYPVFVVTVRIAGKDEVWHRVFIGRFLDRETAAVTARKVKQAEKLDSVLMWQESPS
ncbi:MAG TPA: SPOR domain-containing protein [Nitrospinaceae bacterium]|jgi:cell division protein FtsN|nr:SPOR domain-containing protein [Nitrospinaceae bacterium]HJO00074.1 SPOR domain-containing protein [Nitrospinaceae bacterium]